MTKAYCYISLERYEGMIKALDGTGAEVIACLRFVDTLTWYTFLEKLDCCESTCGRYYECQEENEKLNKER